MKRDPSKNPVRVGVVGYGGAFNMGKQHLEQMQKAGMQPVAVAEVDPSRLEVAVKDFPGIETYDSVAAMLKKSAVELITVITPHNTHAPLAKQILKAGRHVVLEKPMAITTAECTALITEAKKRRLVVSTYHNRHWDGWILRAVEKVKEGVIGDVVRVDLRFGGREKPRAWWRSSMSISGGILYDWGVHLLEYALQVVDDELTEVAGYAWTGYWSKQPGHPYPKDANEDEAQLVARFRKGARVNLTITSLDLNAKRGFLEIVGTEGTYLVDWNGWEVTKVGEDGVRTTTSGKHYESQGQKFYDNIAAHLYQGEPLVITGEWARRPIHILDLGMQSARKGKALPAQFE